MRAFTDSFIVSNLAQNYTVSELHHCITYSVKNTHFFTEKSLSQPQKRILVSWYHKLRGEFFRLLRRNVNAYRKDSKCFKIVQTNRLSVKQNTNASECTAQNKLNSIAFAFDNISSSSSFWDLWMNISSLVNVCSYQKHCCRQKPPDCLHLIILEADLHLLVSKRGNLFDENFDGVQYFGNCCD